MTGTCHVHDVIACEFSRLNCSTVRTFSLMFSLVFILRRLLSVTLASASTVAEIGQLLLYIPDTLPSLDLHLKFNFD